MMHFSKLHENIHSLRDAEFDLIYPPEIRTLSQRHWTPATIARRVAKFLVNKPGLKVLDIGCGPGKFCIIGALSTSGHFTGVEQRRSLVEVARSTLARAKITNACFIQANITEVDFSQYDAFYLFNPFTENLMPWEKIDDQVNLSSDLYQHYTDYVIRQLAMAPLGTRVATYWIGEIPVGYSSLDTRQSDSFQVPETLRFWTKTRKVSAAELEANPSSGVKHNLSAFDLTFEWCVEQARSISYWLH